MHILPTVVRRLGGPGAPVGFEDAWRRQREIHAGVVAGTTPDTVLLLEHEAVFTAGKRTEAGERPVGGVPVIDVDRGGKITWHGPGQVVGYPIVRLAAPIDVVAYVRRVEQVMLDLAAAFDVDAVRVEGRGVRSGIWVPADRRGPERKLGAIGIRVSRQVTMHGFSVNVANDLGVYESFTACGITDAGATSLSAELGRRVEVEDVLTVLTGLLAGRDLGGTHAPTR